jgi:allantoin racemase
MKLLFINPNTTESMTRAIEMQARSVTASGTEIVAVNPTHGPKSIETRRDEAEATAAMLDLLPELDLDSYAGIAIACFGDPGLDAVRARVQVPVVGIAESAMLLACAVGGKFAIVVALDSAVPIMRDLVTLYGLDQRLAGVRATGLSVLQVAMSPERARDVIAITCKSAFEQDGADSVCLGCASMGPLAQGLTAALGRPVIDGAQSAVKILESISAVDARRLPK